MKDPKVNERVRCYYGSCIREGQIGRVNQETQTISIIFDGDTTLTSSFAFKQCRRLKPRGPKIEGWVNVYEEYSSLSQDGRRLWNTQEIANVQSLGGRIRCVYLREVRKKK